MELSWKNLDETDGLSRLMKMNRQIDLAKELSVNRVLSWKIDSGAGVSFYYGASLLTPSHIDALGELADEQELIGKYRALLNGEIINTGEKRRVLHHLTRGQIGEDVVEDGIDLGDFYARQNKRVREFSGKNSCGANSRFNREAVRYHCSGWYRWFRTWPQGPVSGLGGNP